MPLARHCTRATMTNPPKIHRHEDAREFLDRAESWLLRNEAEHNLLLGLAEQLLSPSPLFRPPLYWATIEHLGRVCGCAFRTPPFKLGMTRMPEEALDGLVRDLGHVYSSLPAVMGPDQLAGQFATKWAERVGCRVRAGMRERLHSLEKVSRPADPPPGRLTTADPTHIDLFTLWGKAFVSETKVQVGDPIKLVRMLVRQKGLYTWEDGGPRTMLAATGRTRNGVRVAFVYTPPEFRRVGYASAAVASLSQRLLDEGRRFCVLFTDLSNATSNSIYRRIGYRPVGDLRDYDFR